MRMTWVVWLVLPVASLAAHATASTNTGPCTVERSDGCLVEPVHRDRHARLRPGRLPWLSGIDSYGVDAADRSLRAERLAAPVESAVSVLSYDARLDPLTLGSARLGERLAALVRPTGSQDSDSQMVIVQGSYPISHSLSLDVSLGRGRMDDGLRRAEMPAALGSLPTWRSYHESNRSLWSLALSATRQYGALGLGARLGHMDVRERQESYIDLGGSAVRPSGSRPLTIGQTYLGVDASYGLGRAWELHGAALYRHVSRDDARPTGAVSSATLAFADRNEREWAVGVRFYGGRNFRLNLEYLNTQGRDIFRTESLMFTGRIEF